MEPNDHPKLDRGSSTGRRTVTAAAEPKIGSTKIFTGEASYDTGPSPYTASKQPFNKAKIAGAMTHEKLAKFPVAVIVTYKRPGSGKIIRLPVLINDHGPFATDKYGQALRPLRPHPTRVIDLTPAAFTALPGAPVAHGILDDVTVEIPAGNP